MLHRKCKDCSEEYGEHLFVWLADSLWKEIGCEPHDFLCAHCTIDRLDKIRNYVYIIPQEGKYHVTGYEIVMTDTTRQR